MECDTTCCIHTCDSSSRPFTFAFSSPSMRDPNSCQNTSRTSSLAAIIVQCYYCFIKITDLFFLTGPERNFRQNDIYVIIVEYKHIKCKTMLHHKIFLPIKLHVQILVYCPELSSQLDKILFRCSKSF